MKKRFMFLLMAMAGMALQSMGQIPFNVETPKYQKFVKVTASGVNLRKAPNTNSPRLIFSEADDGCLDCGPSLVWSNKPLKNGDEAARASLLPVIGESGDWYHVHFFQDEYGGYSENVYIMKKFCTDVALRPLSLPAPQYLNIVKVSSGKYKDLCIEWYYGEYDSENLRVGRFVNGMFIFAYGIQFSKNENSNQSEFVKWDNDAINLGKNLFDNETLNLNRLAANTQVLDLLMNNLGKMTKENTLYYGIAGDNVWHVLR